MIPIFAAMTIVPLLASALPSSALSPGALVGPPFVCHELDIGDARSLPFKKGLETDGRYDRQRLVEDVANLLKTETNLVVRMETLRRAAIYARTDRQIAWELLGRTGLSVLEQEALRARASTAWFDTGVLVTCWDQLNVDLGFRAGVAEGFDGYAYIEKALDAARAEKNEQIAVIEFGAALCAHPAMRPGGGSPTDIDRYANHVQAARAGAGASPLLAKNLEAHIAIWKDMIPSLAGR